jgi:hypothetical protein
MGEEQHLNVVTIPLSYPRVTWLEYFIRIPDTVELVTGLKEEGTIGPFDFSFKFHEAIFMPRVQFETAEDARAVLDPMLEAWRIQTVITLHYSMSFSYMAHEVAAHPPRTGEMAIRRRPRPMPPKFLRFVVEADSYPPPPTHWGVDECTRDLVAHYEESLNSTRTLLMHAYAMVTRVEYEHGSLTVAAAKLAISLDVLKWVKTMATERTIGAQARKYTRKTPPLKPLESDESEALRWIILQLVSRSAKLASSTAPGGVVRFTAGGSIAERIQSDRRRNRTRS